MGIIGTGLQARTQLEAVAAARKIERIRAFGRDAQRREKFAKEMTLRLGIPVTPASSAEEAVRGADIVITATTSKTPVLEGRWIEPGTHISAIGVNFAEKREIDTEAVRRCDVIAADSVEQSKIESGDLIQAFAGDESRWATVREFADIIVGKVPGTYEPGSGDSLQIQWNRDRGHRRRRADLRTGEAARGWPRYSDVAKRRLGALTVGCFRLPEPQSPQ